MRIFEKILDLLCVAYNLLAMAMLVIGFIALPIFVLIVWIGWWLR